MIKMEKILLFPLTSGIMLIFLFIVFFFYNIYDILWKSIVRILPRSTRNPTNRYTVTAPAEVIFNQPSISSVEKDEQNQYQRRKSTSM